MADLLAQQFIIQDIYISHHAWLRRWLNKKVGSPCDAADLTQDTFIKLLAKSVDYSQIVEPKAYITTIARGLMINFLRRRDMEAAYSAAMLELGHGDEQFQFCAETHLIIMEKLIEIDLMMDGLPIKVRTAFLLHKLDGLSYSEIAADMGMSVISIKKYIARALIHCASAR